MTNKKSTFSVSFPLHLKPALQLAAAKRGLKPNRLAWLTVEEYLKRSGDDLPRRSGNRPSARVASHARTPALHIVSAEESQRKSEVLSRERRNAKRREARAAKGLAASTRGGSGESRR